MVYSEKIRYLDKKLKIVFDLIDDFLENNYGDKYHLHPNRPERGATANKASDGLFNVGASFSAGFGSAYGRGYVVDVDLATLDHVPEKTQKDIENQVADLLREIIPEYFPDQDIRINRDGNVLKIYGELVIQD
ncbi:MAG: hypothetical protein PQJ61_10385 [Spirochaetales bacterium]|uniref:Uncharacterized protein n=1 Tax=Candidatus Thalassospirochaeta sargassi TaxID=3119039 RepID=A0AAJ1IHC3_9SPIO|nr:hypothetical protein [Spirochaetales bacterium]